jgi:hypothetical protein
MREEARASFAAALEIVDGIDDQGAQLEVLGGLAQEQAEAGDSATILETVSRIREAVLRIEDDAAQAHGLASVARLQAQAGEFAAALETAQRILEATSEGDDADEAWASALGAIIEEQARAGESTAAHEPAEHAEDLETRADLLLTNLAGTQVAAGKDSEARVTLGVARDTIGNIEERERRDSCRYDSGRPQ